MLPSATSEDLACSLPTGDVLYPAMVNTVTDNGYTDVRVFGEQGCAVRQFNFTTAVVVGLGYEDYDRRYCYEHPADAQAALATWDGACHPSVPWIKCKVAGIDLLNQVPVMSASSHRTGLQ